MPEKAFDEEVHGLLLALRPALDTAAANESGGLVRSQLSIGHRARDAGRGAIGHTSQGIHGCALAFQVCTCSCVHCALVGTAAVRAIKTSAWLHIEASTLGTRQGRRDGGRGGGMDAGGCWMTLAADQQIPQSGPRNSNYTSTGAWLDRLGAGESGNVARGGSSS